MKILILGAGRVGSSLASTLSKQQYEVSIVDQNKEHYGKKRPLAIAVLAGVILIFAALIIWGSVTTMTHSM